jgi:peroxiredoxin
MSDSPSVYQISKKRLALLVLLTITLVVLNIVLAVQNRKLKATSGTGGGSRAISLKPGKSLPPLIGFDANSNKLTFDYGNDYRKTVLLVFSPRCPYCAENAANWKALTQGIDAKSFRVVAVSTLPEGVKETLGKYGLNDVPVIVQPDPKNRVAYEMNLTPQTVLIDSGGKVEKVWTGVIQGQERSDVEQTLNIKLPTKS